ncbi:nudix domain-containing protein [Xylariales sp. PMI_506]|nr:nudix domain-containing protein [Xylariales sp. PMI_506]
MWRAKTIMAESTVHPRVGVAALIQNSAGEVIVGKRLGSHGSGSWAVPGGHLEFGESYFACAEREAFEETGLRVKAVKLVAATNDIFEDLGKHYITLFVICTRTDSTQDPQVTEPDKCEQWQWKSWEELSRWLAHQEEDLEDQPRPQLFLPMRNLLREHPKIASYLSIE